MEDHIKFFENINRKRPRSDSIEDQDKYIKDSYLSWISEKMRVFLASPKSYRQIVNQINNWIKELDLIHQEKAKSQTDLKVLTQKIRDKSLCRGILQQLLDFMESHKEEAINKKHILEFLDGLYESNKNKMSKDAESDSEAESDFIVEDDELEYQGDESEESDDEDYDPMNDEEGQPGSIMIIYPNMSGIGARKQPFLQDWNKRFDEIRNNSSKNMSSEICHTYLDKLSPKEREKLLTEAERVEGIEQQEKPMYFKILDLALPLEERKSIIREYNALSRSGNKGKAWLNRVMSLPIGQYVGKSLTEIGNVKKFIRTIKKTMDEAVYGHDNAKEKIIQALCQHIRKPDAKGLVLGIQGVPGTGKTCLIENGIAKVMGRPFIPISLGGATDSSFLEGHSFTYEGSIPGRIAESLIQAKCMNPIFYFDELDKVSETPKGQEIVNLLVHLIDPSQNHHFHDKYFHGISLDLSKATFIFSFNDTSLINRILLDRITVINVSSLDINQKKIISKDYLLPSVLKDMNFKKGDIRFEESVITELIEDYTFEGGVRKFKELIFHIVRAINVINMSGSKLNGKKIKFPYVIKSVEQIKPLIKDYQKIRVEKIHNKSQVGLVNGLWAGSMGVGGILPLEIMTYPANKAFEIKKTGSLESVIKESIDVARTVSWNYLDEEEKMYWMKKWEHEKIGFHIHAPDGATPKDGPSAGTALTLLFYSYLTGLKIPNIIGMTGEINLQGKVGIIGGLKEKTYGAKKAGCKLVLYPKDNQHDMDKIISDDPTLVTKDFQVQPVDKFEDVLLIIERMQ